MKRKTLSPSTKEKLSRAINSLVVVSQNQKRDLKSYAEEQTACFAVIESLGITEPEGSLLSRVISLCDYVKSIRK